MDRAPFDLDAIVIQSPCTVPWESMRGDDRKRFCASCRLHVHDLSQLTRKEAVDLLETTRGQCCLRVWRRPDGRVVTKDCGVVRLAIERRLRWIRSVAAAMLAAVGLAGCKGARLSDAPPAPGADPTFVPRPTMGTPPFPPPPQKPPVPGARESIGR